MPLDEYDNFERSYQSQGLDSSVSLQMVALVVLLANPPEFTLWVMLGYVLLALSAVLTLWSMVVYLIAAWPHLRPDSDQNSAK